MTYQFVTRLFYNKRFQLKYKNLVVRPKIKALPGSEISGLILKMTRSRLGKTQY